MSQRLISRSADLVRLRSEGYHVEVHGTYLHVRDVPYLDGNGTVQRGALVSELELSNDVTVQPSQHVAFFVGGLPHDGNGQALINLMNNPNAHQVGDLQVACSFSRKPSTGYRDYHHKMTTYVELIAKHARQVEPEVTAQTYLVIIDEDAPKSVFRYMDTASTRAGIEHINAKLESDSIAIVGLGGTGAYILDFVAKTPAKPVHLYDGDRFIQHNAFRSPGAAAGEELDGGPLKVDYFSGIYGRMRIGIEAHPYYVTAENVGELQDMSFVFIAVDDGAARRLITSKLEEFKVPFIDVGMGLWETDGLLGGNLRVTTSTPDARDQARDRMPLKDNDPDNQYTRNIQVVDLNALNAAMAVIRWKKLRGYYQNIENEHHTVYTVGGNRLINEDQA